MPDSLAQGSPSTDTDVVVTIAGPESAAELETEAVALQPSAAAPELEPERARRFRRRFVRFRGLVEAQEGAESLDDEDDLRLQIMLLREENARLKAARHKPADTGSLIDRVRVLSTPDEADEMLDETWMVFSECLALRESLDQACIEIQAAMSAVRERLGKLAAQTDGLTNPVPGVANGASNGTANGVANGASNGLANGVANGASNGLANGVANGASNGLANGVSNGVANGASNGLANGANNGVANGLANGAANGVANGLANGSLPGLS